MAVTGIVVTNSVIQVSYEGKDKTVNSLRRAAKAVGYKTVFGSLGKRVTPVGIVKLSIMTVFHNGDPYEHLEAEINTCEAVKVFRGRY